MNEALVGKLDLFKDNLHILNKEFKKEDFSLKRMGALYYTFNDKNANIEDIKKSLGILRKRYKITSPFRSSVKNILVYKLIDHEFSTDYLTKLEDTYKKITVKWKTPFYKALIALLIVEEDVSNIELALERTDALYLDMKTNHRGITSDNDYLMAFLLSLEKGSPNDITLEVEKAYDHMKSNIKNKDVVQFLSHTVSLVDGDYLTKTDKILGINKTFIDKKIKLGVVGLSSIGLFADSIHSAEEITELLIEVEKKLKTIKGFRYVGKNTRMSYASYLLYDILVNKSNITKSYTLRMMSISVMISTINSLKFFSAIQ